MGPWPLFCSYTLLTLETKCSLRFNEVGPQTYKLLSSHGITESRNHGRIVCVEVLRPSQPNGVMSSVVSLPNHMFTGQG